MILHQTLKKERLRDRNKVYCKNTRKRKRAYDLKYLGEGQYVVMYPKAEKGMLGHCKLFGTFIRAYANEKVVNLWTGNYEALVDIRTSDGVMTLRPSALMVYYNLEPSDLKEGDRIWFSAYLSDDKKWFIQEMGYRT